MAFGSVDYPTKGVISLCAKEKRLAKIDQLSDFCASFPSWIYSRLCQLRRWRGAPRPFG